MTRDLFSHITAHYGVPLLAVVRKWIEFSSSRIAMVVARDGFALWGRASASAYGTALYVPAGMSIPDGSVAATPPPLGTQNLIILSFLPPASGPSAADPSSRGY